MKQIDVDYDIEGFWRDVLAQDENSIRQYFHNDAVVRWHCTNELFSVDEYIRANCEYPGDWGGEIERAEYSDSLIITAVRVFPKDRSAEFHAVSFIRVEDGKILSMDEYWADDGEAPLWRKRMNIGKSIR